MSGFFITGTGTDIGKTFVTVALIGALRKRSHDVAALKPVATGFDPADMALSDGGRLLAALGRPITLNEVERISPWRYDAPLSPDMAARREGRPIDFGSLITFSSQAAPHTTLLIEGIGGLMTPLDGKHTVVDWIGATGLPVILVVGSYLGALSHALTALEVLAQRRLAVTAAVVNETADSTVSLAETAETMGRLAAPLKIVCLPRVAATATDLPSIDALATLITLAP